MLYKLLKYFGSNELVYLCLQRRQSATVLTIPQRTINQYHRREHLIMILGFLLCWTPFAWLYVPVVMGLKDKPARKSSDVLPLLMVKFGCSIINPIIYKFEKYEVSYIVFTLFLHNCEDDSSD